MAAGQLNKVVEYLRRVASRQDAAGRPDGDLLQRYAARQDDAAFEALMRRHGPMVLGVCRRILGNHHDAEDAFQATFLVLVRKAAALRVPAMVGNWLYGVAHRTAWHARKASVKRRAKEAEVVAPTERAEDTLADLRPILDEELARLADKYRVLLVLCDLEGRTRKEVSALLGLPEGTVASRLTRARTMLAQRLTKRGLVLSAGALAAALAAESAAASVPPLLFISTFKVATAFAAGQAAAIPVAAVVLAEGVLKMMMLTKLKNLTVVLLALGLITVSGGGVAYQVAGREQRTDKPGPSVMVGLPAKGGQAGDKELRLMVDKLQQVQAEQEVLRQRLMKVEKQLIKGQTKKDGENKGPPFNIFVVDDLVVDTNGQSLIRIIKQAVEPGSWKGQGGNGTIDYFAARRCLVVSNSSEALDQVRMILAKLSQMKRPGDFHRPEPKKVGETLQKVYPVADLVTTDGKALVELIVNTIEPAHWAAVGGWGLIGYFPDGKSLVIVDSLNNHAQIVALLADLRAAKAEQEKKK